MNVEIGGLYRLFSLIVSKTLQKDDNLKIKGNTPKLLIQMKNKKVSWNK